MHTVVVQWSTQRSKKPSLIGCGFESHQPYIYIDCTNIILGSLAEWSTQPSQKRSLIGSPFESEGSYKKNTIMKNITNFILENTKTNIVCYHTSTKNLNLSTIKDFPMFVFGKDFKDESDAMFDNNSYRRVKQYEIELSPDIKILDLKKSKDLFNKIDDSFIAAILSNPSKKELLKITQTLEENTDVDAVTVPDYSQKDYNKDTESILIFHPDKFIKNVKRIK